MQVDEVESTSERHVSAVRGEGQWREWRSHGWRNKGGKAGAVRRKWCDFGEKASGWTKEGMITGAGLFSHR